jgi:predicted glycoside hydrolase/deacetylase ChbG (UPF0249 family)
VAAPLAKTKRAIFLCADDYGMSRSVSGAIRDLLARERINATSVMMVADALGDDEVAALKALRDQGKVFAGLHLTLSAPFKPLSRNFTPLQNGAFLPLASVLKGAVVRQLDRASLAREAETQIETFTARFGTPPDFIDGHQHVQLFPQIRDALLDAKARLAPLAWLRQGGRIAPLHKRLRDRKGLLLDILSAGFRRAAARRGMRVNPAFAGTYDFRDDADFARLFPRFLDGLPADSVVMCHPGVVDEELRRLDPLTTLREREYAYFGSDNFPAILEKAGVTLAKPAQQ